MKDKGAEGEYRRVGDSAEDDGGDGVGGIASPVGVRKVSEMATTIENRERDSRVVGDGDRETSIRRGRRDRLGMDFKGLGFRWTPLADEGFQKRKLGIWGIESRHEKGLKR